MRDDPSNGSEGDYSGICSITIDNYITMMYIPAQESFSVGSKKPSSHTLLGAMLSCTTPPDLY